MEKVLEVRGARFDYGATQALAGVDLDVVDVKAQLKAGDKSATIRATSAAGADTYALGAFVTSISTFKPDFTTSGKTFVDLNGGSLRPGDVLEYTVTITNTGTVAARLVSRHWIITDSDSRVQEVRGMGVVGEQPTLQPQESFEYTSGTAIATPVGTMRGTYQMIAEDGTSFDALIPEFTLSVPRVLH